MPRFALFHLMICLILHDKVTQIVA